MMRPASSRRFASRDRTAEASEPLAAPAAADMTDPDVSPASVPAIERVFADGG